VAANRRSCLPGSSPTRKRHWLRRRNWRGDRQCCRRRSGSRPDHRISRCCHSCPGLPRHIGRADRELPARPEHICRARPGWRTRCTLLHTDSRNTRRRHRTRTGTAHSSCRSGRGQAFHSCPRCILCRPRNPGCHCKRGRTFPWWADRGMDCRRSRDRGHKHRRRHRAPRERRARLNHTNLACKQSWATGACSHPRRCRYQFDRTAAPDPAGRSHEDRPRRRRRDGTCRLPRAGCMPRTAPCRPRDSTDRRRKSQTHNLSPPGSSLRSRPGLPPHPRTRATRDRPGRGRRTVRRRPRGTAQFPCEWSSRHSQSGRRSAHRSTRPESSCRRSTP
jgi:hypothetical protein